MKNDNYLTKRIDKAILHIKDSHFAIYPCGERGEFVKAYLRNKYHLSADFLIDNYKAQSSGEYITTNELESLDCEHLIILIASDSKQYYEEVRKEIRKYVPRKNIIDLFPKIPVKKRRLIDYFIYEKIFYPHGIHAFLHSIKDSADTKILDVGCGNRSPQNVKAVLNKIYYVGIDVGDYNQTSDSKEYADEYHIVKSEDFAAEIERYHNVFDAVISSHNIEHCDEPERVLRAMIMALKKGGRMYMSFPSEDSQYFPTSRRGCLNFYDDSSHNKIPDWNKINSILSECSMKTIYKTRNNQPYFMRKIGELNEAKSSELNTVLMGTWEYYGFESIIWCKK